MWIPQILIGIQSLRRAYKKGYQCCVRGMGVVRKDEAT